MKNTRFKAGDKFNQLTFISRSDKTSKNGSHYWYFKCDCGSVNEYLPHNVYNGAIFSCGCINVRGLKRIKTGLSKTRIYHIWQSMYGRCYRPYIGKAYNRYGGAGITVCDKWHTFEGFHEDMYESYLKHIEDFGESETSLDRIDGTKGYYLENCRWATRKEQANNTKGNIKNKLIKDINGVLIPVDKFNEKYNTNHLLVNKLINLGYKLEDIISGEWKQRRMQIKSYKELIESHTHNLGKLSDREIFILNTYYGLGGVETKTLSEIGLILDVTMERVRQIKSKALEKIIK